MCSLYMHLKKDGIHIFAHDYDDNLFGDMQG